MIGNGAVTIWHMEPDAALMREGWRRIGVRTASVYGTEQGEIRNGGIVCETELTIRIPTLSVLDIAVGDKIVLGKSEDTSPPKGALTVAEVRDNRHGCALQHYRLTVNN